MHKISIVIPTRNRASLLSFALRSALAQDFEDFEVVVSDNFSTDNTREVVSRIGDNRARYVRTDRILHMPDSWEFALGHVRGEFVTYLSDDDAIHPQLLSRALQVLLESKTEVAVYPFGGIYHHSSSADEAKRNQFQFAHPTGKTSIIQSEFILDKLSGSEFTHYLPRVLNCLCEMTMIQRVRQRLGRLFFPIAPDYTAGLAILSEVKEVSFLDDLLLIWGIGKESIGADQATRRGKAVSDFLSEFKEEEAALYSYAPLKVRTIHNTIANSVLRMRDEIGISSLTLSPVSYFLRIYDDLVALKEAGGDVTVEMAEFFGTLRDQPDDVRCEVEQRIPDHRASIRRRISNLIGQGDLRKLIDRGLRRPRLAGSLRTIKGEDHGFSNIFECAQMIDSFLTPSQISGN